MKEEKNKKITKFSKIRQRKFMQFLYLANAE